MDGSREISPVQPSVDRQDHGAAASIAGKQNENRSWLGEGIHKLVGTVWHNDSQARKEVELVAGEFVKDAALFTGKKAGLLGTAVLYGLDSMQVEHKGLDLATDALLGAGKGVSTKAVFSLVGNLEAAPSIKGMVMGSTSRLVDQVFTPGNFYNNQHFDATGGALNALKTAYSLPALAVDAATFGLAHGALKVGNLATAGKLGESAVATTMFSGATFGLTSGAMAETQRQYSSNNSLDPRKYDFGKILAASGKEMAITGLASLAGHKLTVAIDHSQFVQPAQSRDSAVSDTVPNGSTEEVGRDITPAAEALALAPITEKIANEDTSLERPGLDQWSHEIAAKLSAGQVTREQFDLAVEKFPNDKRELAGALLLHSMSNASDVSLMDSARSLGDQLRNVLSQSHFDVGRYMQGNSSEWRHMYTLTADSPGNLTAYLTRKAMNVEAGIREFGAVAKDFAAPDKSGWPVVITDDLSKLTAPQRAVLEKLVERGDKVVNLNLNDFGQGVNFMDFAKGTVHEKLTGLVQEAELRVLAKPELMSLSAKDLAQEVISGEADRAAKAIGATVIRPTPISEADLFKPPVTADDVIKHFTDTYPDLRDRNAAALILKDVTEYFDFKKMAVQTQDLRASILQTLGTKVMKAEGTLSSATPDQIFAAGLAQEKNLLFVVGVDGGKASGNRAASSSALMNHMYSTMNGLPSTQVVAFPQLEAMKQAGGTAGKTVVYLDDAANEGVQIQKRLHGDLGQYPDVMVALIGSYDRFARSFGTAESGRSLVHLASFLPLKAERERRIVPGLESLIQGAKSPAEAAQWQELLDQVNDRARLLSKDGSGTFSISAHQIWPYFTADSATNSVRAAARGLLKIGNPREQKGY
jgi:hypothetical protein